MIKYKFKPIIHVFNLFGIVLSLSMFIIIRTLFEANFLDYLLIFCAIFAMYNLINFLFSRYIINEHSLTLKTLLKDVSINWKEIDSIVWQHAGKLVKTSIGMCAKDKRISITAWTKDYVELIQLIVDKCVENDKVKIDSRIFEFLGLDK